jgi:hypothetical protein
MSAPQSTALVAGLTVGVTTAFFLVSQRELPAKFARIWFPNGFICAVNAALISGKHAQRLGGRDFITKGPGLRPGHHEIDPCLAI